MLENIAIISTQETVFFSHFNGKLCQWIQVTVENNSETALSASFVFRAGNEAIITPVTIQPGSWAYRAYAPTLWPEPPLEAELSLENSGEHLTVQAMIGSHRPWTVYLLSDVCTDYVWNYHDESTMRRDDAALLLAEIDEAEEIENSPSASRNHYNLVHSRQIEFFLSNYPEHSRRLFDHIRRGVVTLNPVLNMSLTSCLSLEALVRSLYPARRWARRHKLDDHYANLQETPTTTWAMATVLAGCMTTHLLRSILHFDCPWATRLEEPPVYFWEGPDGSQVMVRLRNKDYIEGGFVLKGLSATNTSLHDHILPEYAARHDYSFDAIGLVGCYGDLSPSSASLPAIKTNTVAAYNRQGWEFPRLVNASHHQFWDDIEAQVKARQIKIPVYRGDYGSSWDIWPACLAYDLAAWRRAQERAVIADRLSAIAHNLTPGESLPLINLLETGWDNLLWLADHAWNGSDDQNRETNARLRRHWQVDANRALDQVISSGLATLAKKIPTDASPRLMVFNGSGWARSGLVRLPNPTPFPSRVINVESGEAENIQTTYEAGQPVAYFFARNVPAIGYRNYIILPAESPFDSPHDHPATHLETFYYSMEVDALSGGIIRLYDKLRRKELVDQTSPYDLNQCLYLVDNFENTATTGSINSVIRGALFQQLVVISQVKDIHIKTTYTLYETLDRVDICNEVDKPVSLEKNELDFVFPFNVPNRQYRMELPGAIITPGVDQRPGAGQAVNVIRHFVDIFNPEYGIIFSQADSEAVEFGHRTTLEDPLQPDLSNSTVFSLALENQVNYPESIHDQGGSTHFTFRYSLRGHAGSFDPVTALQFSWEDNNELLAMRLPANQQGDLPEGSNSFISIHPKNVILIGCKPADEEGLILRLWDCLGKNTQATVQTSGLGSLRAARQTDLLETDLNDLPISGNSVEIPIKANGVAALRLLF